VLASLSEKMRAQKKNPPRGKDTITQPGQAVNTFFQKNALFFKMFCIYIIIVLQKGLEKVAF
jgi:hypothetical protein